MQIIKAVSLSLLTLTLIARADLPPGGSGPVESSVILPEFFVAGDRVGALDLVVPRGDLRPPEPNLGQELLAIPGVYGHARAARCDGAEHTRARLGSRGHDNQRHSARERFARAHQSRPW